MAIVTQNAVATRQTNVVRIKSPVLYLLSHLRQHAGTVCDYNFHWTATIALSGFVLYHRVIPQHGQDAVPFGLPQVCIV